MSFSPFFYELSLLTGELHQGPLLPLYTFPSPGGADFYPVFFPFSCLLLISSFRHDEPAWPCVALGPGAIFLWPAPSSWCSPPPLSLFYQFPAKSLRSTGRSSGSLYDNGQRSSFLSPSTASSVRVGPGKWQTFMRAFFSSRGDPFFICLVLWHPFAPYFFLIEPSRSGMIQT